MKYTGKSVFIWMTVLVGMSCAGNRINPDPLFVKAENSENTILYKGTVSIEDSANIKLLLKFKRDGSYLSEIIYGKESEEYFTGKGKYSVRNNTLNLETQDSVAYPVIYAIKDSQLVADHDKGGKLVRTEHELLEKYWKLIELNGTAIDTTGKMEREAHLIFKALNSRIFGSGGCNRFSGSYTIKDNNLRISRVISTKMACMDVLYEGDFFTVLESAEQYFVSGDTLVIGSKGSSHARLLSINNKY